MKMYKYLILFSGLGGLLLVLLDFLKIFTNKYFMFAGFLLITLSLIGAVYYSRHLKD